MSESYNKNGLAVTSLVLGLAGFIAGPLAAVPAVILGHVALSKINRDGAAGKGLAITGLVLGYGIITLTIIFVLIITMFGVAVIQPVMKTIGKTEPAPIQEEGKNDAVPAQDGAPVADLEKAKKLAMIQAQNQKLIKEYQRQDQDEQEGKNAGLDEKQKLQNELKKKKEQDQKMKAVRENIMNFTGVLTTIDGAKYQGAKIMSVKGKGIDIIYEKSLKTIKFKDLSNELKEKFGLEDKADKE